MKRRTFLMGGAVATGVLHDPSGRALFAGAATSVPAPTTPARVSIPDPRTGEDVFAWLARVHGGYDVVKYRQVLGAANPYKEGDEAQGLAASDEASRENSRRLLANTTVRSLLAHPIYQDEVATFADARVDPVSRRRIESWTLGELARFLLDQPEERIKTVMPGLSSDVIACVVKLMSNDDLIAVGRKVFNPLPGSNLGARGYMGARTQPNSPTDDPEDIVIQVLDGWSYAVGDVVLGTNPVSSDVDRLVVPESRRRRRCQRRVRHQRREDAPARGEADRALRPVLRDGPGGRWDQRPRQGLRHGDPRVAQVRLCARAASRGRGGALEGRRDREGMGSPERCRRFHRTRGLPHEDAARTRLPRRHRDGQASRPDDRTRHLLHAAHGGDARRPGLVHRPGDAGQSRVPDGAPDQERSDAVVLDDRVSGSCPRAGAIRLQGGRPDVGVLPEARRH